MLYPIPDCRFALIPALILTSLCFSCTGGSPEQSDAKSYYSIAAQSANNYLYQKPVKKEDGWETKDVWNESMVEELVAQMHRDTLLGLSGVLMSHQGSLLLEEYKEGWEPDSLLALHENELLLIATLSGVLQKEQSDIVQPQVKIPSGNYAVKKRYSKDTAVDLQYLLRMETNLLCRPQQQVIKTVTGQEDKKRFYYCPANYQAVSQWLEVQTDGPLSYYAEENLFEPLEIDHYRWDDLEVSMRARDMLKFSALYAQKGSWMQQQLLADDWVLNLQSGAYNTETQGQFSWGWWEQILVVDGRQYATFYSKGPNYLLIFVPDLDAGILFTGNLKHSSTDYFPLLQQYALPALVKK